MYKKDVSMQTTLADGFCVWDAPKIFLCAVICGEHVHTRTYFLPLEQIRVEQHTFLSVCTRLNTLKSILNKQNITSLFWGDISMLN